MTKKEQTREYLDKFDVFNTKTPDIIEELMQTLPEKIPYKMRQLLVISELITFTSQFRINIRHWNGSSIPVNAISFLLAESGASKDSTYKNLRMTFTKGYESILEYRRQSNINQAKEKAREKAEELLKKGSLDGISVESYCNQFKNYKDYLKPQNQMFVTIGTPEGFVNYLNNIQDLSIGAGHVFTSELGAELANNSNMTEIVKLVSELYDMGDKLAKVIKDQTNQNKEIQRLPVSALFMGSQDNILYDETIKKKFKVEFDTKLARRSFFVFVQEKIKEKEYDNIEEMLDSIDSKDEEMLNKKASLTTAIDGIANFYLSLPDLDSLELQIPDMTKRLINAYQIYNEELAKDIEGKYQMTKLSRQHLHWKALKFAGALAIMRNSFEIDTNDYGYAIRYVEEIFNDIKEFEKEMSKDTYEVFSSYAHNFCNSSNEMFFNINDLIKQNFIPKRGSVDSSMKALIRQASIYDKNATYTLETDGIRFKKFETSEYIGVSNLLQSGTKESRKLNCAKGYNYKIVKFTSLQQLLSKDYAYSPFEFEDGIRGKEYIKDGSSKWVAIDVDDSLLTDEQVHIMLQDIRHIIARTSDPTNAYKFRVLIEFDNIVNIPARQYKKFVKDIAKYLGIDTIDSLDKSQIFFSYSQSKDYILTNFDAEPLAVKPFVESSSKVEKTTLTKEERSVLLRSPLETFSYAFQAKMGEGSRSLIRAMKHARDLGATREDITNLMYEINNYWTYPMEEERFARTILAQIDNLTFINFDDINTPGIF